MAEQQINHNQLSVLYELVEKLIQSQANDASNGPTGGGPRPNNRGLLWRCVGTVACRVTTVRLLDLEETTII